MTEILTSAQMRAIEVAAIESQAVTGRALMERAGEAVIAAVFDTWPPLASGGHYAVVLCGPGNNGGDGFVIARLLHGRGWRVAVHLLGAPAQLPPDAQANWQAWSATGQTLALTGARAEGRTRSPDVMDSFAGEAPDLVVDAVFGTGLTRPLWGAPLQALLEIRHWMDSTPIRPPTVAVDIPSGLDSDSGRDLGVGLPADLTVTFHCAKLGHYLGEGPDRCGRLVVADIGLPTHPRQRPPAPEIVRAAELATGRLRKPQGHKYDHGHALILAGGVGRGGAARLAARAALRVGAGLVTLACPPAALIENAARLDAVMLRPLQGADALSAALGDPRLRALCLGPGLGLDARGADLVGAALATPDPAPGSVSQRRGVVLDADALTLIGRDASLRACVHVGCVLTPHMGEFARLMPEVVERAELSRVDMVRSAASELGCVVLLKGRDTVIAAPDGTCALSAAAYDRAAPWLATAGAGDVLAGLIAGLIARGLDPFAAAVNAARLHVDCALHFGPGLIAEDLPECLPQVLRAVLAME